MGIDTQHYHTVFHEDRAIPLKALNKPEMNRITIDTLPQREGLTLAIVRKEKEIEDTIPTTGETIKAQTIIAQRVQLTREDARNLIQEIQERLF